MSFQGLLALPDCQGSRVPRAEKVVLGFQGSQAHLAIPVTKALQGLQGLQGSPVLQEAQVSVHWEGSGAHSTCRLMTHFLLFAGCWQKQESWVRDKALRDL